MPSVLGGAGAAKPKIRPPPKKKGPPSLLGQAQSIVGGVPRGIAGLVAAGAKDVYRATPADDIVASITKGDAGELLTADWFLPGAETYQRAYSHMRDQPGTGFSPRHLLEGLEKESPLGGALAASMGRTGTRLYQTVQPLAPGGKPAGENPYVQASREGTLLGTLIEDVGNYALIGGPVVKGLGGAAGAATRGAEIAAGESAAAKAASSTAARTVASVEGVVNPAGAEALRGVQSAAREAAQARRAALTTGAQAVDPAAAAAVARADAQLAAARAAPALEPVQAARAVTAEAGAAETAARVAADQAWQRFDTANKIVHFGNQAAASPFIPFTKGAKTVGNILKPVARAAGETGLGQRALTRGAGLVENAQARLDVLAENRAQKQAVAPLLEAGAAERGRAAQAQTRGAVRVGQLAAETTQKRSLLHPFGGKAIKEYDPVANNAVLLLGTNEAEALAGMMKAGIGRDEAVQIYARQMRELNEAGARDATFDPPVEAIEFAYDVLDPNTTNARAIEVRANEPEIYAHWRDDLAAPQRGYYERVEGEAPEVVAQPHEAEFREWNVRGTTAQTAHMAEYNRRRLRQEARRERLATRAEKQGAAVVRAAERLEDLGPTPAERANPALFLRRVQEPAIRAGQMIADRPDVVAQLAETSEFGALARRVIAGNVPAAEVPGLFANRLIELLNRKATKLGPEAAQLLDTLFAEDRPQVSLPTGAAVGPAREAGAAVERLRGAERRGARGEALVERGQATIAQAEERMRALPQANAARVRAAVGRVQQAAGKLRELRLRSENAARRARRGTAAVGDEGFKPSRAERKEVIDAVRDLRVSVTELRKAARQGGKDFLEYLESIEARYVEPPRRSMAKMTRAERIAEKQRRSGGYDFLEEVGRFKMELVRHHPAAGFPDEVLDRLHNAGVLAPEQGLEVWAEMIRSAKQPARILPGEVARQFPDVPYSVVEALVRDRVKQADAADIWLEEMASQRRAEFEAGGGRAAEALEADRLREMEGFEGTPAKAALTEAEQRQYEATVAGGKADVQANIVAQRAGQAERAALEGAERARAQGQREGAQLGRGEAMGELGAREVAAAEREAARAEPTVNNIAELDAEAVRRAATPVGRFYRRVGKGERAVREAAVDLARTQRALARVDAKLLREHTEAMNSIEANPSRYRPAIAMGRAVSKDLLELADEADAEIAGSGDVYRAAAAEQIVLAKDLVDRGLDPLFLIGKRSPPKRSVTVISRDAGSPGAQLPVGGATGAKQKRTTGVRHGQDIAEVFKAFNRTVNRVIDNKTGMAIQEKVGRPVIQILRERGLADDQIARMSGAELRAALEEGAGGTQQTWAAWNPREASAEYGQLMKDADIKPETVVIPHAVWNEFRNYADGRFGAETALYDKSMRVWKGGVLALTGRWHVGNVFGNAIMATFGGNVGPWAYTKQMQRAKRIMRATEEGVMTPQYQEFLDSLPANVRESLIDGRWAPPELLRRGLSASDWQKVAIPDELHRSWIKHPIERSYGVNGWVDDMNRLAVYLDKVEGGLSAVDYRAFKQTHPEFAHMTRQQVEREAAIKLSIRAMGDFTKLRPFERKYVKRILPFYPWLRHITRLTGNLLIHDPLRVAFTLHLADMFAGDDESQIPWLSGAIPLEGDKWLRLPNVNPFQDVLGAVALGPEGYQPEGLLGSVSPGLALPAAAFTGMDIRNMAGVRRSVEGTDAYGRPQGQPLISNPEELLYMLGSQFPQMQVARELVPQLWGSQPIRRYPTGEPYVVEGKTISANEQMIPFTDREMPGMVAPWLPLMGIPRVENIDTEAIESRAAGRKQQAELDRQRYARQREVARQNAARGVYLEQ